MSKARQLDGGSILLYSSKLAFIYVWVLRDHDDKIIDSITDSKQKLKQEHIKS